MLPEKGVAYVKFQVASQAARALEALHLQTIKDGRVTVQLKVLYADPIDKVANNENRSDNAKMTDPDNHPPRSRLFLVVPRDTSPAPVEESMDKYEGLEYVKTDLVKSKGIIYVKFRLASSALRAKEDIEKNNYMLCGKRVKVFEAEPKCNSPHDDARHGQTRPPSKSPQSSIHQADSENPSKAATGMSPPFPDLERNPQFMAYLVDKGVSLQQIKDSCYLSRQLQQWFSSYVQDTGAPPSNMTQGMGDDWHASRARYYSGDHKVPHNIPNVPHASHPMPQPPAAHMQPPMMQPLPGGARMSGPMPTPADTSVPYRMPVDNPVTMPHHDHGINMPGVFAQAGLHSGLHSVQVGVPPPGVPYNHKHPHIPDSQYQSHPAAHHGYIPADDFTQSIPIHDNWGHSSQSITLNSANVVPPSMTTLTPLSNMHGPGSGQGMMTTPHNHQTQGPYAAVSHSTNPSFTVGHGQGGYQNRWAGVRGSGHSAVPSPSTSISSLDARMSTPVPHTSPALPPGFMMAPKTSKQLLIMFAISAIPEMQVVEQFTSCVVKAYEGCEKCSLVYGPTSQMASQPLPSQSPHTHLSGSYNGPINLGRNSAPIPPHNSMGSLPVHNYSRSDLLSNSLNMPQRSTSPVHVNGPNLLPAISDTMASMYTDLPGQGQSTADSKAIDAGMGANNSSSSDTKQDGTVDSSTSRALEVVQAGGVWPKKAPEVVFFHCTPLRGQTGQIPRAVCDNMFGQCGAVASIVMHPTEIRWGAVTFADSSSAAKLLAAGHQEAFSFKVECIADDVSPAIT